VVIPDYHTIYLSTIHKSQSVYICCCFFLDMVGELPWPKELKTLIGTPSTISHMSVSLISIFQHH
jgi:hypothetical protein